MVDPGSLLLILATAVVAGVLAGMLGIGGGVVIVPALLVLFDAAGVDPMVRMQLAVGTSLATIVFTSISSAWAHHRKGALEMGIASRLAPGVVLGSVGGVLLAAWMPGRLLEGIFGIFLIGVALRMVFGRLPDLPDPRAMPLWACGVAGLAIGGISTMVGIGGGVLSVPIFVLAAGLTIHRAVGTAPILGLLLSTVGTATWIVRGLDVDSLPHGCVGFVALVPAAVIATGTMCLAPVGASLAHRLPRRKLSMAFAILLVIVASRLVFGALHG